MIGRLTKLQFAYHHIELAHKLWKKGLGTRVWTLKIILILFAVLRICFSILNCLMDTTSTCTFSLKYFSLNNTPTVVVFTEMTKLYPREWRKKIHILLFFQAHNFCSQSYNSALQFLNLSRDVVFFFCLRQKQIQESGFP